MTGSVASVTTTGPDLNARLSALLLLGIIQALAQVTRLDASVSAAGQGQPTRATAEDALEMAGNVLTFLQQTNAKVVKTFGPCLELRTGSPTSQK